MFLVLKATSKCFCNTWSRATDFCWCRPLANPERWIYEPLIFEMKGNRPSRRTRDVLDAVLGVPWYLLKLEWNYCQLLWFYQNIVAVFFFRDIVICEAGAAHQVASNSTLGSSSFRERSSSLAARHTIDKQPYIERERTDCTHTVFLPMPGEPFIWAHFCTSEGRFNP